MQFAKGKLIAIGGAEDKGTPADKDDTQRKSNLNFLN